MACEVPVIASRTGGIPEVVVHGETGWLAPVGGVDQMAERALEILKNPDLQQQMGQAGRQRVIENFSSDKIVPLYLDYYKEIIKGAGS